MCSIKNLSRFNLDERRLQHVNTVLNTFRHVAHKLQLSHHEFYVLERACLFHDIGFDEKVAAHGIFHEDAGGSYILASQLFGPVSAEIGALVGAHGFSSVYAAEREVVVPDFKANDKLLGPLNFFDIVGDSSGVVTVQERIAGIEERGYLDVAASRIPHMLACYDEYKWLLE